MVAEIKNVDRESLVSAIERLNAECLEIEITVQEADWLTPEQKAYFSARVENAKSKTERMRTILDQMK